MIQVTMAGAPVTDAEIAERAAMFDGPVSTEELESQSLLNDVALLSFPPIRCVVPVGKAYQIATMQKRGEWKNYKWENGLMSKKAALKALDPSGLGVRRVTPL